MKKITVFCLFLMQTSCFLADETIQISDDGRNPIDQQRVVVINTETKQVVDKTFQGTQRGLSLQIDNLKKTRTDLDKRITAMEALFLRMDTELKKLPPRNR